MAENLVISEGSKSNKYSVLYDQIIRVMEGEDDMIANMANISSMIHQTFGFWWTGFYRVDGESLVLGPFQGPLACSRIKYGRGVCGTAWKEERTVIVPDVDRFPGHIACSSASRSEIVVPVFDLEGENVIAVMDIDSDMPDTFDETDKEWLEKIAAAFRKCQE